MNSILKSAVIALSLATAGLAVSAPAASAASIELELGTNGVIIRDNNNNRHDNRRHDDRRGFENGRRHNNVSCSPGRALSKAESMGLRRVRLTDADRRHVTVRGEKRGHRVRIVFANVPSCPVISYR